MYNVPGHRFEHGIYMISNTVDHEAHISENSHVSCMLEEECFLIKPATCLPHMSHYCAQFSQ